MFSVTFYSYKGGVGRTMALLNTAFRLSRSGKRVFILDFDLEAPGVDAFKLLSINEPRPGVVEYISAFTDKGEIPPINDFVAEAHLGASTPVYVMSAGKKDRDYRIQLSRMDWKYFYKQKNGFLFVENLKGAIQKTYEPDYLLVDSRTGLTDISGICTLQVPDLVVLLFNLNNQNLEGISSIYESIVKNKVNKDIRTLFVASPVPDVSEYASFKRERLEYARKAVGVVPKILIPYDPVLAFEELIVSGDEVSSSLARAYDQLTHEIVLSNRNDVTTLLQEARTLRDQGDLDLAELHYKEALDASPSDPDVLLEYGLFQRIRKNWREALASLERSWELAPSRIQVLFQLIRTYLDVNDDQAIKYFRQFLTIVQDPKELSKMAEVLSVANKVDLAIEAYQRAQEFAKSEAISLELGNLFMRQGKFEQALANYAAGISLDPVSLQSTYNAGYALQRVGHPFAKTYFSRAIELFEQKDLSSWAPGNRANAFQAISHAYAATGEYVKAAEALRKALSIAKSISHTPIYSSTSYRPVAPERFINECEELLSRIELRLRAGKSSAEKQE
jgi:tetratricopeptide (TPR) repeat protein